MFALKFLCNMLGVCGSNLFSQSIEWSTNQITSTTFTPFTPFTHFTSSTTSTLDLTCPTELDVIGAGLPKTGTQSTKRALEILGFQVYNVESMIQHDHVHIVDDIWHAKNEQERNMYIQTLHDSILDTGSTVVLDIPCNFLYAEFHKLSPNAKVLLTTRDVTKWLASVKRTFHAFAPLVSIPYTWWFDIGNHSKIAWESKGCTQSVDVWEPWFMPWVHIAHRYDMVNETRCKNMFLNHNLNVTRNIPESHLVVYNVKDGWEPLIHNIGALNPQFNLNIQDFPHLNVAWDSDVIAFCTRLIAYGYPLLFIMGLDFMVTIYVFLTCSILHIILYIANTKPTRI